ncbi:MAG: hypothetical protein ACFB51_01895, partial [Anaerolineae bacterium]
MFKRLILLAGILVLAACSGGPTTIMSGVVDAIAGRTLVIEGERYLVPEDVTIEENLSPGDTVTLELDDDRVRSLIITADTPADDARQEDSSDLSDDDDSYDDDSYDDDSYDDDGSSDASGSNASEVTSQTDLESRKELEKKKN